MNLRLLGGALLDYLYNELVTHLPLHFARLGFLRLFNRNISSSTKILMHTRILHFWGLETSENVVVNQHCVLDCRRYKISIGNNTDVGPYTKIWTLGHDPDAADHGIAGGDVVIGHHVWIASGVTILPKLTIGNGAVIASASVVSNSVDEKAIMAGNPAKKIRNRNNALSYQLIYNPLFE